MNISSISIVIPVYNEQESLAELQLAIERDFESMGLKYEVIYVDDGSSDDSYSCMKEIHQRRPDIVRLIQLRRNFGQTAAIAAGFDSATGELIIPMDADLQNDPADIKAMVDKINEGYDIVSGWRASRKDKFFSRRLPSMIANGLISRMTGVHLHDYGCTLKAYRRDIIEHMNLYGEMHRFLPALASWAGARVTEMPVTHHARKHGASKYGIGRTTKVILDLITVKFLLSYSTKPMQVFGKWGFLSLITGFLAGLLTIILKIFASQDVTSNPWIYICMLFTLGGMQLIGLGLLGEINVRTYYESQKKSIYAVRERIGKE